MTSDLPDHDLNALFEARSVAILGASSDPQKLGGRPIRFLLASGFKGKIYPVNPKNDEIQGLKAYKSVTDIPEEVEQAIIILPAKGCVQAMEECAVKGIRVVQLFSSGFAEEGEAGSLLQQQVMAVAVKNNIRVLGPNCLGIVGVSNRFFATFSTALEALEPLPGVISIATQSGAFGSCAYSIAIQRGMGLSRIAATGNEADIDVALCIDFFATDPATKVICAALEGCRNGNRLRAALLKAARNGKPVILMKVGVSKLGIAAAATHTGSLAGHDAVFEAIFAECGALRAHSIEEMLDIAYFCAQLPEPSSSKASIVTVSGGIGILMADECEHSHIELPDLPSKAKKAIRDLLPFAPLGNPMDTTAQVTAVKNGITTVMKIILAETDWPIMMLYMAQSAAAPQKFEPMKLELFELRKNYPDRCFVLIGPSDPVVVKELERNGFVVLADPSRAVRAMGGYRKIIELRTKLKQAPRPRAQDPALKLPVIKNEIQAKKFLELNGISVLDERLCVDVAQALRAATIVGYPVALKIVSEQIIHKTEIGGVILNLQAPVDVEEAFSTIMRNANRLCPDAVIDGILVSPMALGGVETILGTATDPIFGPMVMFGLGGVAVELFRDVAFASAPLSEEDAASLIDRVRSSALLKGWRGQPTMDIPALVSAVVSISEIATRYESEISSIDMNPFLVKQKGAVCLDAVVIRRE
jgi:acyl-CoA synthetase (NDP forming)